jgi:hypothetical protein
MLRWTPNGEPGASINGGAANRFASPFVLMRLKELNNFAFYPHKLDRPVCVRSSEFAEA